MKRLFENISLEGAKVLDAMCGSGQVTEFLLDKGCQIEAFDISPSQTEIYRSKFPDVPVREFSVLSTEYLDNCFDIVVIFGGLHHVHPYVSQAVTEVHRILKPAGLFIIGEPHSHSIFDLFRRIWYRRDPLFEQNEAAIDFQQIVCEFSDRFDVVSISYGGNIAYLLVYNSLIFRVPTRLKAAISPVLLALEELILPIQNKQLSFYGLMQWRKK